MFGSVIDRSRSINPSSSLRGCFIGFFFPLDLVDTSGSTTSYGGGKKRTTLTFSPDRSVNQVLSFKTITSMMKY